MLVAVGRGEDREAGHGRLGHVDHLDLRNIRRIDRIGDRRGEGRFQHQHDGAGTGLAEVGVELLHGIAGVVDVVGLAVDRQEVGGAALLLRQAMAGDIDDHVAGVAALRLDAGGELADRIVRRAEDALEIGELGIPQIDDVILAVAELFGEELHHRIGAACP